MLNQKKATCDKGDHIPTFGSREQFHEETVSATRIRDSVPSDRTREERKVSSGNKKKNELQKKSKRKRNLDKKENRVIDDAVTSAREKNLFSSSLRRRKFFSLSKFLSRTHFFPFSIFIFFVLVLIISLVPCVLPSQTSIAFSVRL
jgi:thiol:disulfide interchange protein